MDDVERMYRHLVRTLRTNSPQQLTQPFTVADLYQSILPYRLHRRDLGLETNQDYEMAMLELLSGARGYLEVDDRMRDTLTASLRSPNPDPMVIREFSQTPIALDPEGLRRLEQEEQPGMGASNAGAATGAGPGAAGAAAAQSRGLEIPIRPSGGGRAGASGSGAGASASAAPVRESTTGPFRASATTAGPGGAAGAGAAGAAGSSGFAARPGTQGAPAIPPSAESSTGTRRVPRPISVPSSGATCQHCNGALPAGRDIVFCPHCGQDLTIAHCPACGSELEHEWKFCVTCGRATGS